jgi:hypothetical protein
MVTNERDAQEWSMLYDVETVLSEAAILTIVDGERSVTDNRMQRRAEAFDVKTVGSNSLPGEVAAGAETTSKARPRP